MHRLIKPTSVNDTNDKQSMNISVELGWRRYGGGWANEYSVSVEIPDDEDLCRDRVSVTVNYKHKSGPQSGGRILLDRETARWLGKALIKASNRNKFEDKVNIAPG
jgi:hypothetical protein